MAYTVYNNSGTILVNIPNGEVDDLSTSLSLVGKNVNNYGEIINNNFIKLLTSFANVNGNQPSNPQPGQLFYDMDQKRLKVYDGSFFKPVYQSQVSGTAPIGPAEGEFWFDSINDQFRVYDGEWKTIGPAVSSTLGKFGIEPPPTLFDVQEDITNQDKKVSVGYSYGYPTFLISTTTFTVNTATAQYYFNTSSPITLYTGITALNNLNVRGNAVIEGNLVVKGNLTPIPYRGLTSYYNRTWIGSTLTDLYTITNNVIRLDVLPYLFSTSTTSTNLLSEIRVLTSYNTATEVRHYRLEERVTGVRAWEAYEIYNTTGTLYWTILGNTNTNVVKL